MNRLRRPSIRRKLTVLSLLTSGVALGIACAALMVYEVSTYKREMVTALSARAEMLGGLSTAALSFDDAETAREILGELRYDHSVLAAAIYRENALFASYARTGADWQPPRRAPVPGSHRFSPNTLEVSRAIQLKGVAVGSVVLRMDIHPLYTRLLEYFLIVLVVLAASVGVAMLFASRMQRTIAGPVVSLSTTAVTVVRDRDYSVRAQKASEDELGALTDAFNQMLAHIQAQDEALRKRILMERLASELSTEFINVPANQIDQAIDQALRRFGQFAGVDRCHVALFDSSRATVTCSNEWTAPGVGPIRDRIRELPLAGFPWCLACLDRGEAFVANAPDQLPAEAALESRGMREHGIRSSVVSPMALGEHAIGWVGFDMTGATRCWSDDDLNLLRLAAQIIMHALERKRAAEAMSALNDRLIDASRQAGMAEVATGVLHNVGNVLNSVNVSAGLAIERLRESRVSNLAKLAGLIEANAANLAHFFTADPRGRKVPAYLASLAGYLEQERQTVLGELESLGHHIDHIKAIVAMQQNYATVSGVVETIPPAQLVDDALRLNAGALARHGVKVAREFEPVPPIAVEKHKVLQILVNLIRNAKYALDETGAADKRLRLCISASSAEEVRIEVIDNGVGISAANLTRIFQHGFTTRKDGHGFGLHSGALTARELGGRLAVQSDGHGTGARFTLDLPVAPPSQRTPSPPSERPRPRCLHPPTLP